MAASAIFGVLKNVIVGYVPSAHRPFICVYTIFIFLFGCVVLA